MLNFKQFIFDNYINVQFNKTFESLVTSTEKLLKTIDAEEVNLFEVFDINKNYFRDDFSLEFLYNNEKFNNLLNKNNLKKSDIQSTEDIETFLEENYDVKFFTIHQSQQSNIEKPKWLIIQSKKKSDKNWGDVKCYKVNNDMRYFYDEMSSKTIELKKDNKSYIYRTHNSGTEWVLQNLNNKNKTFKEVLTNEEIKKLLTNDNIELNIIS